MRRTTLVLAPLILAACSFGDSSDAAGVPAQGSGTVRTFAVSGFDSVDLRGSDDADIRVGSGFSVRAEGDPDVLDRLLITREGSTLRIDRKRERGIHWSSENARVIVTMPRITGVRLAGSGNLSVDRAEGARFSGAIAGSGNIAVGTMAVDEGNLSISGSGNVQAKGSATRLIVSVAGSGDVDAADLHARNATVNVAGSGKVRATLDGEGEVRIAGSGDVDLGRKARCTVRAVGSGTARCGG